MPPTRLLRSVLFCPGDREKLLQKALTLNSDALIVDLEDAVGQTQKITARDQVQRFLQSYQSSKSCIVRINCPHRTEWGKEDLSIMMQMKNINAVLLPKVESDHEVESVSKMIYSGTGSHIPLWAMIETPKGVLNASSIAEHPQIKCLVFGSNDLTKEIHAKHTPQREPLLYSMSHCILAARAAKKFVLDGVHTNLQDMQEFKASCSQGRNLGFDGKTLIHPSQIEIANEMYSPSNDDIDFAVKIVKAWKNGGGIVKVDGKMIELLHYEEAKEVLQLALSSGRQFDDEIMNLLGTS